MDFKHVMLALLLVPLVSAQGPFFEIKGDGLDAALDNAVCKQEYMVGILDSVMEHVEGTDSLQANVDDLNSDVAELEQLADADDFRGFVSYVRTDFEPHLLEARGEAIDIRNGDLTLAERAALRTDFAALTVKYASCNSESAKRYANAKVAAYEEALSLAGDEIDDLSGKGIETSGLSVLVRDARSEIVEPLKDELSDADSGTEIRLALAKHCLFDGCPRGENFHFAAQFGHEKLQQILYFLEDRATAAGMGDDVEDAQAQLDEAKSVLDKVGAGVYSAEEGRVLWESLRDAAGILRGILTSLRSGQ